MILVIGTWITLQPKIPVLTINNINLKQTPACFSCGYKSRSLGRKYARNHGFTLIEILLVVFIMGLSASLVSLSLPPSPTLEGDANEQAERLMFIMQEISDRASMEGRVIGLRLEPDGYTFLKRVRSPAKTVKSSSLETELRKTYWDEMVWTEYTYEELATSKKFGEEITVSLEVGGLSIEEHKDDSLDAVDFDRDRHNANAQLMPQILFYPTGEVTPFRILFKTDGKYDKNAPVMLIGSELGNFHLFDPEKDKL